MSSVWQPGHRFKKSSWPACLAGAAPNWGKVLWWHFWCIAEETLGVQMSPAGWFKVLPLMYEFSAYRQIKAANLCEPTSQKKAVLFTGHYPFRYDNWRQTRQLWRGEKKWNRKNRSCTSRSAWSQKIKHPQPWKGWLCLSWGVMNSPL